jgi:hypothetical protein
MPKEGLAHRQLRTHQHPRPVVRPQACYQDLGPSYYEQRMHAHRQARNHVKGLQRLGYQVTIQPVDPDTGEILATAG